MNYNVEIPVETKIVEFKPEILDFAEKMQNKIKEKEPEYGNSYLDMNFVELFDKLMEELIELRIEIQNENLDGIEKESVDVSNILFFIHVKALAEEENMSNLSRM